MPDLTNIPGLRVRPGRADDLPLVRQICANVYDDQDYVPQVWESWLENPANQPFILELNGEGAGLYCLRVGLAGPGSGWVQGVRVAQQLRGRKIGRAIIQHAIQTCQRQKLTVLRFTTAQDNTPMHHLAEIFDFRPIGNFASAYLNKESQPILPASATGTLPSLSYRLVTTSEFDGAYHLITNSPEYAATSGFYCDRWWWKPLGIEQLRSHIEQREVYSLSGALRGLAIFTKEPDDNSHWLAFLTGEQLAAQLLLGHLVKKAVAYAPPEQKHVLMAVVPQTALAETVLPACGFIPEKHEPVFYLYELKITNS